MSQGGQGWGPPGGFNPPPAGGGGWGPPGGNGGGWGPPGGAPPQNPFGAPPPGYPPPGGFGGPVGGYGAPPPPPKKGNSSVVALGAIGAVVVLCTVCGIAGAIHERNTQNTYGALNVVCEGRGVPGARAYVPGNGQHRVVGAVRRSSGDWHVNNTHIRTNLLAGNVADTDVVACFGEETEATVETCTFYQTRFGTRVSGTDRLYPRVQKTLPVRLVAAATGQTITSGSVVGSTPRLCGGTVSNPSASMFRGSSPGTSEIGRWLDAMLSSNGMGMIPL